MGNQSEWKSSAKYLGVELDKRLTLKQHVDNVIGKTQTAIKILYPLISRRSQLHINNKLLLFRLGLRPIYTYGSPILVEMSDCHFKKMQVQQNKILKMIFDLPWRYSTLQLHEETDIEMVKQFCNRLNTNFVSVSSL